MKKVITIIAVAIIATSTVALAQNTKRNERTQARELRQQEYTTKLTKLIAEQNFTFIPQNMQTQFGPIVPINNAAYYLSVYPDYLSLIVPYVTYTAGVPAPRALDFDAQNYKYESAIGNDKAFIKIYVNNVPSNQNAPVTVNSNYTLHLEITLSSGNAILTVVPNFNSSIQYFGNIQFN